MPLSRDSMPKHVQVGERTDERRDAGGGDRLTFFLRARVLTRLKPLLLGEGRKRGDGLRMPKAVFDGVRQKLMDKYDATSSPIGLFPLEHCEVLITA